MIHLVTLAGWCIPYTIIEGEVSFPQTMPYPKIMPFLLMKESSISQEQNSSTPTQCIFLCSRGALFPSHDMPLTLQTINFVSLTAYSLYATRFSKPPRMIKLLNIVCRGSISASIAAGKAFVIRIPKTSAMKNRALSKIFFSNQ
ncbi:hypothetical protein CEXT_434521 [Caerostris extrusa]|uniref:Uncharacterized protein n=1 Tax=Caerostris extrusa TaxID=172846 RepID=A0AAV4R696_CAEEX|nr:hypothetical protein CEXT_434521 [Caerostris extrusa]